MSKNKFFQEFELYEKNSKLTNEEKKQKELNAYANFCVNFVNSLKKALNFSEDTKESIKEEIAYITKICEIDIPYIRKNKQYIEPKKKRPIKPSSTRPPMGGV